MSVAGFLAGALIGAGVLMNSHPAPQSQADVQAWIERHDGPSGVVFTAHAKSARAFEGDYSLVIEKTGSSGTSRARQGGQVVLTPGQALTLSRSGVGQVSQNDVWSAVLEVRERGALVASDRITNP
jgi:hypothetical protein